MTAPAVDCDIDPLWGDDADWESLARAAVAATARVAPEIAHDHLEFSLVMADDDEVAALNGEWRDKPRPTNVLSFPMLTREDVLGAGAGPAPVMLGDVILAHGVCAREAAEKGIAIADHATHLIIHGLLHLAGYDHETSDADAAEMEDLERKALASLGLADPYAG